MLNNKKVFALIMCAGRGTRIGVKYMPKHMLIAAQKPVVEWVMEPIEALKKKGVIDRIIIVVGFHGEQIINYFGERAEYVWQKEPLGTANAVERAREVIGDKKGIALITNGDHPLYSVKTIKKVLDTVAKHRPTVAFSVVHTKKLDGYGRIIRNARGDVTGIVEKWGATKGQMEITEKNVNLFAVDNIWLFKNISRIKPTTTKQERYICDIVSIALSQGKKVEAVDIKNADEAMGVNTKEELKEVEKYILHHR